MHKGVSKFVKYVDTNYKNYNKLKDIHKTQVGYIKIKNDERELSYHTNF